MTEAKKAFPPLLTLKFPFKRTIGFPTGFQLRKTKVSKKSQDELPSFIPQGGKQTVPILRKDK